MIIENSETSAFQLKTLDPQFKGAVCSSLDEVVYLNQKNFKSFSLLISNEYLKTSPITFYFPKNSFLVEAFDEKISFSKAAGLIDYWISKHMDLKYIRVAEAPQGARSLTLQQISGILKIWLAGCLTSSIVFLLEYFQSKMLRCNRIFI